VLSRLAGRGEWSIERLAAVPARVTVDDSGRRARIVFDEGGIARLLIGGDCEEVTSAAALILAVALGSSPRAVTAAPSSPAQSAFSPAIDELPAPATDEPEPALSRTAPAPSVAPPASSEARLAPDSTLDAAPSPPPTPRTGRRWGVALGGALEANNWVGPWPATVFEVSLDAVSPSRGWSARVAGVYGMTERAVNDRRAEFSYWGGHLDLCPIALGGVRSWRWTSCLEFHLGSLEASGDAGSTLATALSQRALLATLVAGTRLQTPPLWTIRFELDAGVAVPLLRQTFQFGAPEEVIFQSPAIGLLARAGIVVPLDGQRD
jgi:hypothetical protein